MDACVFFKGKPMDGSLLFKRPETNAVMSEVVANLFDRLSHLPPSYTATVNLRITRIFQGAVENLSALLLKRRQWF
jgi:hypothetical protein